MYAQIWWQEHCYLGIKVCSIGMWISSEHCICRSIHAQWSDGGKVHLKEPKIQYDMI